ncbi:hypothetical protein FDENT_11860 [Fusarium denticulatum]|uniref:Uncharacterized protein n=1 Tax=Fusarium denticulatum TaxID=48507 RepID=A0A8H5T9Q5_9HYPO|nr:hypothetical protein FDENT_11860 [Fusarium denticulatum]
MRDYLPWNTGWAKMSELIESYEVRDGISNRQVDLDVPKSGGTLEVVNSRTALVVNKHWILILGLLGRYGDRFDKGILQLKGIRRNFDGERASIRHFALPRKAKQRESDLHFEWVRKKQSHAMSRRRGSSSRDSASSRSWSDSDTDSDGTVMAVRRSAYGTITLETTPQPTIYGITGKLQQLGRHKGSWSYLTSVSFVPHIVKEIFEAGVSEKREGSSLQTLFWLAHGFLPCGRTAEGRQMVISLEAPDLSLASIGRDVDDILAWPAYCLQESDDVPISIGIAMQCLGIPEPQILQFLPLDPASEAKRVLEKTSHHFFDATESPADESDGRNRQWERELPAQQAGLNLDGPWVRYSNPSQENFCLFRRLDFEKTLRLVLTIDWDNWGFLIWKDKFWISILRRTTSVLKISEICDSEFGQAFGLASHSRIFDWKQSDKFYPQRLADQLSFDKFLTEYLDTYDLRALRLSLGVLYILDEQLRENTLKVYANLCNNGENNDPRSQARIEYLESALEEVEAEYRFQKILHKDDETPVTNKTMAGISDSESVEEVYTHMLIRALDTETLERFNIVYERADDLLYRITGYIAPWEQKILFKHTSIRRELHQMKASTASGVLEYTYKTRQLKWYSDKTSMLEYSTWQLTPQDVVITGEKQSMWIEEKDMVMVALAPEEIQDSSLEVSTNKAGNAWISSDSQFQGMQLGLARVMALQNSGIWDREDVWLGIASPTERRKRQNRIHQRAYRKKKLMSKFVAINTESPNGNVAESSLTAVTPARLADTRRYQSQLFIAVLDRLPVLISVRCPDLHISIKDFLQRAFTNWGLNLPDIHDLPNLTRLNTFDALARNAETIQIPIEYLETDDYNSLFNTQGPKPPGEPTPLPPDLRPTQLQRTIKHHSWLDLFPIPGMRDNILRAIQARTYDEDYLCEAICCDLLHFEDGTKASLTVWGESWDANGWEFSPGFFVKWGALLQGCVGVLQTTNYWRQKRGAVRLDFKLD